MPSNVYSGIVSYMAGKFPGSVGMLISPHAWAKPPFYMPYAYDNGAFYGFKKSKFLKYLNQIKYFHCPLWVLVPDVVSDPEATLKSWHKWYKKINFPLAFACQDGHEPQDVPKQAICCFIGGSTKWKLKNAHKFKGTRKYLHIGRVNYINRLNWAEEIGADSVDGSGWFRSKKQKEQLLRYIFGGEINIEQIYYECQMRKPRKKQSNSILDYLN